MAIYTESGTLSDGIMSVYSGNCTSLSEFGCTDDWDGVDGTTYLMPAISIEANAGSVIYIRFWGWEGVRGTFKICAFSFQALNGSDIKGMYAPILKDAEINAISTASLSVGSRSDEKSQLKQTSFDADQIELYPNPANELLSLQINLQEEATVKAEIINLAGHILNNKDFGLQSKGMMNENLSVEALPSGVYWLRLQIGEAIYTKKVIIMH